tara:strand:- start:247 stop:498 length:252 start_codon:yes stop_codon:yes gene_type:complete
MFQERTLLKSPYTLIREEIPPNDFRFVTVKQEGEFYLVIPETAKEVFFLQMVGHNIGCFLPADNTGLLVRKHLIDPLGDDNRN